MKKSVFLPVKKMAIVLTVILAGFISFGSLKAQTVITSLTLGTQSGSLTYGTAGSVTFPVSFTTSGTGAGSSVLSINWTAPTGATTTLPVTIDPSAVTSPVTITITTSGTTPAGTTSFTVSSTGDAHISGPADFVVGAKPVTVIGLTGVNKEYDRTTTASATGTAALSGVIAPDVVTLGGTGAFAFATSSVGTAKPITVTGYTISGAGSGNYILIQPAYLTGDITAKALTITGLTGVNKIYDGTTTATTTGTATLSGVVAGDEANVALGGTPVLNFATATVGSGKAITVTGYTISGTASGNYTLTQPTGLTANITEKALTITGLTGVNKVYNGTTTATTTGTAALSGVVTGDIGNVTLGGTPVLNFADALVGDGKTITVTGYTISGSASANYTLTQPAGLTANITPLALTITGLTGVNKEYDGTIAATTSGTAVLTGVLAGDAGNVVLGGTPVFTFATATVGTGKAITVTGYTLIGTASGNYSIGPLTGVTANITVKPLTLPDAAASNKPYDATAAATITGTLTGIIVPDVVTLTGTGTFASVNVGTGIAVTSTSTLGGAAAGNYSLTQPAGLTANITLKPLTITATGPAKFYGTALTAGSSTTNFTTTGIAGTESITSVTLRPNAAGLLAGTAAGAAYTVTPSLAIGAGGFLFSNYTVTYVDFAGTVSPKPITVTPNAGQRKLVGTANPVLTYTYAPALIGSDVFTGALSRATGETVAGSPYAITIGTLSAGTNYNLSLAPETFAITPASDAVLTAFNFTFLPNYPEVINQTGGTITVSVANSANVTTLVANFTVSPGATVRVGGVVQTSGVTPNNFTGVVNYVVTSNNGLFSKTYAVTVNKNAVVVEKQLLSFSFAAIPGATGVINQTNFTVTVPIPYSYNVTSLVATFTLSPMAQAKVGTVLQTSGVTANNFTAALTAPGFIFTIQSENGGTRNYYVSFVRDAARTEKQLLTFSLPGIGGADGAIDEVAHTVELTVPFAYVLTNRAATFTSSFVSTVWIGAAQQTSGVTTNDFTSALTYTVKAENVTSTQDYVVHVTKDLPATGKQLITFQFNGLAATANGVIDETAGTIAVTIPFSANKASLVATFTNSSLSTVKIGTNLQVSGTTPNNFTADVVYRVIAEDLTFKDYTVHVTQTPASILNQLLTFSVAALGGTVSGTINETTKSVLAEVPYGTNIADLVATFTVSQFATVKIGPVIGGAVQTSGVTHNNFTSPVAYRIIAEDGSSEIYTVVVRVFPAFVTFTFNDVATQPAGIINHTAHTITVHVPFSVDKSTLKAYFTVSGGATVSIDATAQTSGVTVNNFTAAKTYTLQVPGGSNSNYVVSVVSDPVRTGKQMLTFAFNGLTPACTGVINETAKTVTVNVPYATNVTNLVASFTLSELASAKVGTVAQASGVTPNNFTASVVYTVIAEDGLLQDYAVTVIVAIGSSAKDITYFAFEDLNPDVVGVITQTAPATITATVPNGTNRAALRAFYTASPLSTVRVLGDAGGIQQSGLTINDFRIPVVYQVAAQDGSLKTYTVTVGESADTTKPIVSNAIQTATNQTGQYVLLRSNEATGKVFIISTSVSQTTIAQLEAAVTAGYGRSAYVSAANADIPISTSNLPEGFYYAYAIDAAGNKSLRGTNLITVYDRIPPIVSVEAQTKSNSLTNVVNVRSSDASSLVYLILEGVPQLSKLQLDAAVTAKKGTVGLVQAAYVDVPLSVYGLLPGNYHAYAVDLSAYNNMSAPSPNVVVITEASRLKSILAFSFNELTPPAIGQIVLTDISVKLRVGTPVTALVATFTLSPLSTAYVGSIQQVSDVTPNDFTNPVVYKVIAENGTFFNYTVTVSFNTGIDESEWLNSIKSYPNPVSDRLTIEMTRPADRIQIINGLGQIMEDIHNPGQTTVEIQTSTWMKGIYFIRYYLDEQYIGIHKLIKD